MTDASQAFTPQPLTQQSKHDPLHAALNEEQHYRQLEWTYYQSAQYAAMVERYPLLQSSIAACRSMALISDACSPAGPSHPTAASDLQWERSHGEG
jgi:hypothetical protein